MATPKEVIWIFDKDESQGIADGVLKNVKEFSTSALGFIAFALIEGFRYGLTSEHRSAIVAIGEDYSDKWYEYPEHFWRDRPKVEELKSAANFLTPKVQIYIDPKKAKSA